MTYSVWQSFITDGGEQVVAAATVSVFLENSGAPATLYDGPAGSPVGSSVVSGLDGLARFFVAGGVYKIVASKGAFSKEFRHVQLGTAASRDAGQPSGIATLDGDALVPSEQVPSYAFANLAAFPATGALGKIYLARDTGKLYTPVAGGGAGYDQVAPGLSPIANKTILGNISGVTAAPVALTVAEGQELLGVNFVTQTRTVSAPNATIPAHQLQSTGVETNIDLVLSPKGNGGLLANPPDSTSVGGNKRGIRAVDWQQERDAATQVAAGAYSVIGGGRQNTATAPGSVVVGGTQNTANGEMSFVGGGSSNTAYSVGSTVSGGSSNYAGGSYATIAGGVSCRADGESSFAAGSTSQALAHYTTAIGRKCLTSGVGSIALGSFSYDAGRSGVFAHSSYGYDAGYDEGIIQTARMSIRGDASGDTPKVLTVNGGSTASADNVYSLRNNQTATIKGRCIARTSGVSADYAIWEFTALLQRGNDASSTVMLVACTPTLLASGGDGSTWALAVTADNTYGALRVTGTGSTGKSVRWGCALDGFEVVNT